MRWRYTPLFLNFNVKVRNLFFRLTSSFPKTSENGLLFAKKINFAGTTSSISRYRFPNVNVFILFPGSWLMKWKDNLKFLLVYVQQEKLFCTDQQRIYRILLLLFDHPKKVRAFLLLQHATLSCRHDDHENFCPVTNCKRSSCNSSRHNLSCCSRLY